MGHSILIYRGRKEIIHDLDLLVILGFALQITHESVRFENLQKLREAWKEVPKMYGPGVIDLKIDELIKTDTQVGELRTLLETVLQQAAQYHEQIPADILEKMVVVPGIRFNDYRVEWVNEAIKKLRKLIDQS